MTLGGFAYQWPRARDATDEIRARVHTFEMGQVGTSVRMIDLSLMPVRRLYASLVARGFEHRRSSLLAHRGAHGEPWWRRRDGTATSDPRDPEIVPVDTYVHPDGGFVRVLPLGDPLLPLAPEPAAPCAYVGVLLVLPEVREDPFTGKELMEYDASAGNVACRVSPSGHPIPRGPRRAHGLKSDPANKLKSLLFAREVMHSGWTLLPALDEGSP